jgi:hypothetical protein
MLIRIVGTSVAERVKSSLLIVLVILLVVALRDLSAERIIESQSAAGQAVALAVGRLFAVALTTYDYAHPEVQLSHVAMISSPSVTRQIAGASQDLVAAKASSVGAVTSLLLVGWRQSTAEVVAKTYQLVSTGSPYQASRARGILDIDLVRSGSVWRVSAYRWVVAATAELSP